MSRQASRSRSRSRRGSYVSEEGQRDLERLLEDDANADQTAKTADQAAKTYAAKPMTYAAKMTYAAQPFTYAAKMTYEKAMAKDAENEVPLTQMDSLELYKMIE